MRKFGIQGVLTKRAGEVKRKDKEIGGFQFKG